MTTAVMSESHPLRDIDIETLRWMADGKTAAEIAEITGLTKWGVQTRISRMMGSTGAANAPGLVAMAFRNGWIQ